MSSTKVILEDKTEITDFDYLVCCTGSFYDLSILNIKPSTNEKKPLKIINAVSSEDIIKSHQDICNAKKIVIIGAGPGIEIIFF